MQLVIAEKQSVAESISKVIGATKKDNGCFTGSGYIVSWCVGHLITLAEADKYNPVYKKWRYADLPIIPEEWQYIAAEGKSKQLKVLTDLLKSKEVDSVVNACDAGREGELIFRLVYNHSKTKKPIKRLWISSMENAAIKKGFATLKDGRDYDNLYQAALSRQQADWLVGINSTRLFTVLSNETMTVGRVQTPTLAMIVNREREIAGFVSKPFYIPEIDTGEYIAATQRYDDKAEAEKIRAACDGKPAEVIDVKAQRKTVSPPKLYDLTTLQREANLMFGYTAQETLDIAQALYEKKLATYPRTDSKFLTSDMMPSIPQLVKITSAILPFLGSKSSLSCNAGRIVDNSKVSDHHAIIPTQEIARSDLNALPAKERNILVLVAVRLVSAVADLHVYNETTISLDCAGYMYSVKGRAVVEDGWKGIEQAFKSALKAVEKDDCKETALPTVVKGKVYRSVVALVHEGATSPPKRYTEDTLLSAMENAGIEDMPEDVERKGIGTPATRASIIEKLVKTQYVERKSRSFIPTDKAGRLIDTVPENIKSPVLTGEWEHKLKGVERGNVPSSQFIDGIASMVTELISTNNTPVASPAGYSSQAGGEKIGQCPRCGADVLARGKGYFCSVVGCEFALWVENRFFTTKKKKLTKTIAKALLKDGRAKITRLWSETKGKEYDAVIVLNDPGSGKYVNFKMEFGK